MRIYRSRSLKGRSLVSVVIPCYNYGHYLRQCVGSVLASTGSDLDIIIVDDCSTDDSLATAQSLSTEEPRVRVIAHQTNKGHIATYNDGLARARGDFVVLLSADDLLTPGSLDRSVALMEAHPEVGLVYGMPAYFSGSPGRPAGGRVSWSTWTGDEWLRVIARRGRNLIVNPEAMVRREVLDQIGGYDEVHPHAADLKFWVSAAMVSGVGRVNGAQQAWYRIHESNMHSVTYGGILTDYEHVKEVFADVLAERPRDRDRALRSVAVEALRLPAGVVPDSGAEASSIAALAKKADPAVVGTWHWRRFQALRRSDPQSLWNRMYRRSYSLRWKVRSRRWRAIGV